MENLPPPGPPNQSPPRDANIPIGWFIFALIAVGGGVGIMSLLT